MRTHSFRQLPPHTPPIANLFCFLSYPSYPQLIAIARHLRRHRRVVAERVPAQVLPCRQGRRRRDSRRWYGSRQDHRRHRRHLRPGDPRASQRRARCTSRVSDHRAQRPGDGAMVGAPHQVRHRGDRDWHVSVCARCNEQRLLLALALAHQPLLLSSGCLRCLTSTSTDSACSALCVACCSQVRW